MLTLNQATLSRGNKVLLEQASLNLYEKQKIGLVGNNGCGKSTLFSLMLGELSLDQGTCQLNRYLSISHLSQQLPESHESALEYVIAGDDDYDALRRRLKHAEETGQHAEVITCHGLMEQSGGYSKPAVAAAILSGLGFKDSEHTARVNSFSGGWRMRLNLARCLMKPADLLLLDEPTNHLDMEAIYWLERWLKQSPATIILISHDRDFLDAFVSHIVHIGDKKTTLYTGNYSRFEQVRAQQLALQQAQYEKQQQKIHHMMDYVARFRAKASKAKQAQSRLKAVAKMEVVAQAQLDSPFSFDFFPCSRAGKPLIRCNEMSAGYHSSKPILKSINWLLNPGDRIGLLGQNGEGKSTFIKTLTGDLDPLSGTIERSLNLQIGYYAQHQLEHLDCNLSPIQTIQQLTPQATEQSIRNFLGGFYFMGDTATHPIQHFSGGEKARLALAKLVWQKPNVLLLDEPTNHLDLGMRAALEIALQSFEGALILISHDRHFVRAVVDDFHLVNQQKVRPFEGEVDDYYQWLQTNSAKPESSNSKSKNTAHREKQRLSNKMKKLEQTIEASQKKLTELEQEFADATLYEASNHGKLQEKMRQKETVLKQLQADEDEWMQVVAEMEESF